MVPVDFAHIGHDFRPAFFLHGFRNGIGEKPDVQGRPASHINGAASGGQMAEVERFLGTTQGTGGGFRPKGQSVPH